MKFALETYDFKETKVCETVEFVTFNRMKTPGVRVEARYAFEFMKETGAKPTGIIFRDGSKNWSGKNTICHLSADGKKIISADGKFRIFVENMN